MLCRIYKGLTARIGLLPAMFVFLVAYMRLQGRESWSVSLMVATPTWIFSYLLFHRVVAVTWPQSLLGDLFPAIRSIHSLNII